MKKFKLLAATTAFFILLAGCAGGSAPAAGGSARAAADSASAAVSSTPATEGSAPAAADSAPAASGFNTNMAINVVSREDGSGTRGAFIELLGIEVDGIDHTFVEADIANGTSAVITSVSGNTYSIGYISLGSLNETVTAVPIDGIPATPETVQDGSYPVFRSFYLAIGDLNDVAQDFLNFVLSAEGQDIVASRGYIVVDSYAPAFDGGNASGTVVITGSTSVAPVMERIAEAYEAINPNASIEVHSSGSGAGITAARDGTADIGMSSRDLRESELVYVDAVAMAHDGIAIIVNNDNPVVSLTAEEVRQIFVGEIFHWSNFFN